MEEKSINLTYETLFELFTREKNREELQKLDAKFYDELLSYLREKKGSAENPMFSDEEKQRSRRQVENIIKIIKELYDRREKKIIFMALNKTRTNSGTIDSSALLEEEQQLFNSVVQVLSQHRNEILNSVLNDSPVVRTASKQQTNKLIRFLHDVPKFVGKELEIYGPFKEEDVANLPAEVAEILLKKGKAEEIEG
jgi:DNA replication initiation complex subunit (GINS family)